MILGERFFCSVFPKRSHTSGWCLSLTQDSQSESGDSKQFHRKIRPRCEIGWISVPSFVWIPKFPTTKIFFKWTGHLADRVVGTRLFSCCTYLTEKKNKIWPFHVKRRKIWINKYTFNMEFRKVFLIKYAYLSVTKNISINYENFDFQFFIFVQLLFPFGQ